MTARQRERLAFDVQVHRQPGAADLAEQIVERVEPGLRRQLGGVVAAQRAEQAAHLGERRAPGVLYAAQRLDVLVQVVRQTLADGLRPGAPRRSPRWRPSRAAEPRWASDRVVEDDRRGAAGDDREAVASLALVRCEPSRKAETMPAAQRPPSVTTIGCRRTTAAPRAATATPAQGTAHGRARAAAARARAPPRRRRPARHFTTRSRSSFAGRA